MRIKYNQQITEVSRFKNIHNKTQKILESDESTIKTLKKELSDFKKGKAHI